MGAEICAHVLFHWYLTNVGSLDDGYHFVDAFREATLHPNPFDSLHTCNDVPTPVLLFYGVICPLGHGIRQENGKFIPNHLLNAAKVQRDKNIGMVFDELHMMPQLLL